MDVDAWLGRYREKFAPYEVPGEEREQLITEGEVGKYPGDDTLMPKIERSGRKEFDQLKSQRLDLTGQVKQARQREKELHPYPKIERFADKVLGYVPGILSPDVPQAESAPKPALRTTPAPPAKPSRFEVEDGEIIDTKNRQIIAPHEFNRLSTPQEKDDIAAKLQEGGYLMDEPAAPAPIKKPTPAPTPLADAPVDLEIPEVHVVGERSQPAMPGVLRDVQARQMGSGMDARFGVQPIQAPDTTAIKKSLDQGSGILAKKQKELNALRSQMDALIPQLQIRTGTQEQPSPEQVDQYNSLLGVFNQKVSEYNAARDQHNQAVGRYNETVGTFGRQQVTPQIRPRLDPFTATPGVVSHLNELAHPVGPPPPAPARSFSEAVMAAVNNFSKGVVQIPADALKSIAIAQQELAKTDMKSTPIPLEDRTAYKLGKTIEDMAKRAFPSDPDSQKDFLLGVLPQAAGSMTGFLGGTLLGVVAKVPAAATAAGLGAMVGGTQQYEDASHFTEDPATKAKAFWLGSAVGTTEALPIAGILNRYNKATGGTFFRVLKEIGVTAAQEFIQEGAQQTLNNKIAQELYDEHRPLFENAGISASAGGITGAVTGFLAGLLQGRKIRKQQRMQEGGASESPFAGEPTPPPQPPAPSTPDLVAGIPDNLTLAQKPPFLVKKFPSPSRPAPEVVPGMQAPVEPMAPPAQPVPLPQLPAPALEPPPIVPVPQAAAAPEPLPGAVLSEPEPVTPEAMEPPAPEPLTVETASEAIAPEIAPDSAEVSPTPENVLEAQAHEAATSPTNDLPEPTQAQKEAGNYKKGHTRIAGLDISIENPQGSTRSGVDQGGKTWEQEMTQHYGYIRGVPKGKDGDHIDVFVNPTTPQDYSGDVFVVDQVDPKTGKFDETKTLIGFKSLDEARRAYLGNYRDDWNGLGNITKADMDAFKQWLQSGKTTKPFSNTPTAQWVKPVQQIVPTPDQVGKQQIPPAATRKPASPQSATTSKQDERGNPEFDYSNQPKRPTVKQIIGDWKQAGRPKSFTARYGETDAKFHFEELHGIPQWWDEGNGARGIDRNRVLDALKAEKLEGPETATPPTPELASTALPTQGPKKAQDTPTPERVSTESPSRQQEPTPEQVAKPEPKVEPKPEPKAEQPPTPDKIEYVVQSLRPGAAPETLTLPKEPAKPKEEAIAVPLPNGQDVLSSVNAQKIRFKHAKTLEEKEDAIRKARQIVGEYLDVVGDKLSPERIGGFRQRFNEITAGMEQAIADLRAAEKTPPTPEAVTKATKPDTIPVTPEEVLNAKPQRTRAEDSGPPPAVPPEVAPSSPGERQAEGVRPEPAKPGRGATEQPGGKRVAAGRSDGDVEGPDLSAERGGSAEPERADAAVSGPAGTDYILPESYDIPTGQKGKFKANVAAITLLKRLEAEGRLATPDEQATLAKYTGWGGLPQAFEWSRNWDDEYGQLRNLLTDDEYKAARASTPNAHYTDPATIRAIHAGLQHLGFKGGRVLEPGAGVGHFFGAMPPALASKSQRTAIELDSLSARIAKQLYQRANVIQNEYQKVPLPKDFFDVAVGNVPFADVKVFDPNDKDLNKLNLSLHDYYFAKAISQVRPSGIVAFITSRYTMDKVNGKLRDYLSKHADLLGAIRLPNTQFKDIANTDVTTDIIVLQRREPDTTYGGHPWSTVKPIATADGDVTANEYFAAHPEQIMGKLSLQGSMYRDKEPTVQADGRDMAEALKEAFARLPENVLRPRARPASTTPRGLLESLQATDDVKNGAYTIQNNALYVREGDRFDPVEGATPTDLERAKGLIGLREQVREVFKTQLANDNDAEIAAARKELNARYDKFVKKWGPVNGRANKALFRTDPDYATLQALEKDFDPKTQKAKKADIFSKRVIEYRARATTAGTPKEALLVSLNESGAIDWERMAELTGQTPQHMQDELKGVVYQDPSGSWEPAAAYLSGNVRQKLKAAEAAAKVDPRYQANVDALQQVIPEDLKPEQIHMKMGHGWVPPDVYAKFIAHLLQGNERNTIVKYNSQVVAYSVTLPKFIDRTRNVTTFGTERYPAADLLNDALHSTLPTVYDRTSDDKRVVNEKETLAAREKLEAIQEEFRKWVWQDQERATQLGRLYNDEFNSVVEQKHDGAHLSLPGANPLITLRPHQKNVIWRALQSGNTLLAHVVGAGKTFAMIGIALESRRLRLANKPMIAVPNHIVEQWRDSVLALYPAAKVLMATKEDFEAGNRKRLAGRIATGDWDLVVIAHSQLSRIPISVESFEQFVNEQVEILEDYIREAKAESGKQSRNLTKELEKAKKRLQAKLERRKAEVAERSDNAVNFEETGVDMLLVDEADLFKNLWFPTRMTRVAGLPNSESQRSYDLFLKTQYLNKMTKNRGVIFATGTPVSNSMAEVFTMQRYLQPQVLEHAGLTHFDAWARQFGNTVTSMELAPDGIGYRPRTRFAEFVNVPELTQMFRQVMDVQGQEQLNLPIPKLRTGKPINMVAKPSDALKSYTKSLIERAEALKKGRVDPRKDNMLKITGDGRNAALDVRLRVPDAPEDKNSKVVLAINTIVDEWKKSTDVQGTQLVFLDLSTPKGEGKQKAGEEAPVDTDTELGEEVALRGSVYQDIKRKLIKRGIPEQEIAFIHDADTDAKKTKLFADVNAGRVRVLIGSTEKMGAGTNVQERMVAIHNIDAPWRPRDLEQRNGRGIRQGNKLYQQDPLGFEFAVFNYATEAPSFDVYMWQTLESKAKTIAQVMKGDPTMRTIQDVDTAVLSMAEMKAIASGNPLIKERMTIEAEVRKLQMLNSQHKNAALSLKYELATEIPSSIAFYKSQAAGYRQDKQIRDANPIEPFSATIDDVAYTDEEAAGKAILQFVKEAASSKRTEGTKLVLGTYRGFSLGLSIFLDGDANLTLTRVAGKDGHRTSSFNQDAHPAGLIDRLNNALNKIDAEIENADRIVGQKEKRQDELHAEINKPFEKAARLKELEAKLAEIDKKLDLTNKDEGVMAGPEPTPIEEPKPGVIDKLLEERGSFSPFGTAPKYAKEAARYRNQRAQEEIGFMSSDPDIEARVRQAKKGLQPASLYDKLKDHVGQVWHLVSREFEHLPDTAQFSTLRTDLLKLQKYKGIAADKIQRDLSSIIKPLSRKQYDQLEWKALLSDLSREAEQGHALPFGYTPEKVQEDLDRLNEIVERDPKVQEAWEKRQRLWDKLKGDYKGAMDAIGFDVSKKLTKQDYFRHQVLEHAKQGAVSGSGSKVRTPTGRGFLKTRKGSSFDINANYVQAEFEVMAQMVYDTELAKVIKHVDRDHNIKKQLDAEAKTRNKEALTALIEESGEAGMIIESQLKDFKKRMGMHMAMLKKALELEKDDEIGMKQVAAIADDLESPGNPSARGFLKAVNERKAYIQDLLGPKYLTWDRLIPDTHELWQPREGNVFYFADSIPANLAKALQEGMLEEAGFPVEKLRKVLAQGGAREEYVIPKEASATLDNLSKPVPNWFVQANRQLLGHWKQLMLIAPRKVIRYNVRNLTGDADALFVGNPSAFARVPQAAKELMPVIFKDEQLTGEAKQWAERGGYGTTLQFQELGDVNELKAFAKTLDRESKGGILSMPLKAFNGYWKAARLSTDYREAMFRYAAYLDYLKQMQANNGKPKNFGASKPETVMALPDIRDRAFKLSNELLGAYDRVSVAGHTIRNFWIPFYSWMEVNATRYLQLTKNALDSGNGGQLKRGAFLSAKQAAGFMIRLSMFWSMLQAWNYMMFGDDEDELRDANPTVANRPHILFGRDENGKIQYLSGIGALGDLLAWFGLDAFPGLMGDIMHDRITIGEALQNAAKAPVNKIWQGITPTVKMPIELSLRESTYPDVFHPRPINDRGDYLGNQTTFGPEIQAAKGKPGKPLYGAEDLTGLLVQRSDPKSSAYGTWNGIERKYLERMGKDSPAIFWRSPRGEAISNWARAIAEKDTEAITTWKGEYEKLEREKHGTKFTTAKMYHDIEASLRAKAPLAGVTKAERETIMKQLDAQEKRTLTKAEQYYRETILQVLPASRRYSFEHKLEQRGWLQPEYGFTPESIY